MRLVHLTDPHLTSLEHVRLRDLRRKEWLGYQSWARRRRHRHLRDRLDVLSKALLGQEPDLICITGDLVHIGLPEEHDEALEWLESLGGPERVVVVPGNHDIYTPRSWTTVSARWLHWLRLDRIAPHPHAHYPISLAFDDAQITLANSSLPMPWYSAEGELGSQQRIDLADLLAPRADRAPHVLLLHHPPEPAAAARVPRRKALRDADKAADALRMPDVILHGHTHQNYARRYGNARVFSTASASADDASFRMLDISRDRFGAFAIEMTLFTVADDDVDAVESDHWRLHET